MGKVTDNIARLFRQSGVTTHIRPYNTIRSSLVRPKDKVQKCEQSGLVYHVSCADCQATYIGETERPLGTRLKEHQKTSSPIGEHMGAHNHSFAPETITVKCKEKDWFRRGIAEAIWIAKENPSLNRDRGRHTLPPVYNQLLSSRDTHTTQGARDDTETADN